MYLGDTRDTGLHQLAFELLDNALDECFSGAARSIALTLNADDSITVEDDGSGALAARHPALSEAHERSISQLEAAMMGSREEARPAVRSYASGPIRCGLAVINALSDWCEADISYHGIRYRQRYERGLPVTSLDAISIAATPGTKISSRPDPEIFHQTRFRHDQIRDRCAEVCLLNPGLQITFADERKPECLVSVRGIEDHIEQLTKNRAGLHQSISISITQGEIQVQIAFRFHGGYVGGEIHGFVNNGSFPFGSHVDAFLAALHEGFGRFGNAHGWLSKYPTPNDYRTGLSAVISVRMPSPHFEGCNRRKLHCAAVAEVIKSEMDRWTADFIGRYPDVSQKIVERAVESAKRGWGIRYSECC